MDKFIVEIERSKSGAYIFKANGEVVHFMEYSEGTNDVKIFDLANRDFFIIENTSIEHCVSVTIKQYIDFYKQFKELSLKIYLDGELV